MKKYFLILPLLIFFLAGCSLTQSNITSPSSLDDQLDEEINSEDVGDETDELAANLEHDANMSEDDTHDGDIQDAIADFETQLEHDVNMLDDATDDGDMEDAIADFETQLEHDVNMLEDGINDGDMQDVFDDFEAQLEHDVNMLDDAIDDGDMQDVFDDFKARLEHDLNMLENDLVDFDNTNTFAEDLAKNLAKIDEKDSFVAVSCNSISKMSICVDYIGDFWTQEQMTYACEYSGVLSDKPCASGSIGGCEVGKGSFNDMIIWMYPYGGAPISSDTAQSAKPACDMNPMGSWVNAR